jgi:4-azaleucine resistance transporter AzlC
MGYTTMGFVAGVLLAAKGDVVLSPLWGFLSASTWVSGTMSFAFVPEVAARSPVATIVLMAVAVNFRYAFYGFSLLERWKGVSLLRKAYLVLMLTDENYALEAAASRSMDPGLHLKYCTAISAMNHSYWIVGVTVGALVVRLLGMAVDPDAIRARTDGMEFAMVALFLVIFTDQMRALSSARK